MTISVTSKNGDPWIANLIRKYLEKSLIEAEKSLKLGNYPIGSIFINKKGDIEVIKGNKSNSLNDVSAHAEILGIRKLGKKINKDTNDEYYLFTSLEPCFGCSFFLARTNVKYIYSALKDPHKGGITDLKNQKQFESFFKQITIVNEPFEDLKNKSMKLMKQYFLNQGRKDAAVYYGYKE